MCILQYFPTVELYDQISLCQSVKRFLNRLSYLAGFYYFNWSVNETVLLCIMKLAQITRGHMVPTYHEVVL